jgi:ribosome-binding ATPase
MSLCMFFRGFESEKISHIYDRIDPIADFEIVQAELIFKDIESVEKRISGVEKMSRIGAEDATKEYQVFKKVLEGLNKGTAVIDMDLSYEEQEIIHDLWLLTNKKRLFLLNTKADIDNEKVSHWRGKIEEETEDKVLIVDIKLLSEMVDMDEKEIEEYMEMLEEKPSGVGDIINSAFDTLNLITFYTGSEKECNAWSIVDGSTVKQAAGVIHTDLEKGFITADVVNVEEMIQTGGWVEAKEKGLVKNHSKEYIVKDGDYIVILANTK